MPDTPAPHALPVPPGLERSVQGAAAVLRTVAFWLAVVLPVAYPVALATDVGTLPFLLAGHATAVALGHGHQPGVWLRSPDDGR